MIGVKGELAGSNLVLFASRGDELLGQFFALPIGNHPSDDVTAEDVEDRIEVEVGPLGRPQQFGDIPSPELVGTGGQQLGLLVGRMGESVAAFARLALLFQDAVQGAARSAVDAFVEKCAIDLSRRAVLKALGMQVAEHDGPLPCR